MRAALLLLLLAACDPWGRPPPRVVQALQREAVKTPQGALDALPRQSLRSGECKLFLWANAPPRLVIAVGPAGARIARAGRVVEMGITASEGEPVYGFAPNASYAAAGVQLSLALTIEERNGLVGGAAVPGGSARVTAGDGSEITVPVAGLIGCG